MTAEFAPKDAETIKAEVLEDLGEEYEGNEEKVDKIVARRLKDEEFKASLHADKKKHLEGKKAYEERMRKAGLDPETGAKLAPNDAGAEDKTSKNGDLSSRDIIALRDVPEEDIDEVVEFAKFKGISIAEAKKNPIMQNILKTRAEERKTAEAASTNSTRRTSKTNTADNLLAKVQKNNENFEEDLSDDEIKTAAKAAVESLKAR